MSKDITNKNKEYTTNNRCDECGGYMICKTYTKADSSGARVVVYYECPNCHEDIKPKQR